MDVISCGPYYAVDLAVTHDTGCRVQQQFYINAILGADRVLFGVPHPLGTERRPGQLLIGRCRWEGFLESVSHAIGNRQKLMSWSWTISRLLWATQRWCGLWEANELGYVHARRAVASLHDLMAFNVLFNVFPVDAMRDRLARLMGEELAAIALQWASYPFTMSHYTRLELAKLSLALRVARGKPANLKRFIRDIAFAFTFYISKNPMEDPATLHAEVERLAQMGETELRERRDNLVAQTRMAHTQARRALCHAYQAQVDDPDAGVFELLYLWRALATQEEERHWLQLRVQRNFRWILEAYGLDLSNTSQEQAWSLLRKEAVNDRLASRRCPIRV